jgi:CheY-like chemotaxis protein
MQVESKLGGGSTFYFILSLEHGTGMDENAAKTEIPPLNILVVDDNVINQRVVAGLLDRDRHKIVTAGSAETALKELEKKTFDIIFMDMEMPGTDGIAATQMIRRLPDAAKANIPVIAMTGNIGKEDIQRCKDAGMNDHVGKPVTPESLRRALLKTQAATPPATPATAEAPQPPPAPFIIAPEQQKLFNLDILGSLKDSLKREQLTEMMKDLYEKSEELIAEAEKAVVAKDLNALKAHCHSIKGMTANFGLAELSNIAGQIERKAKDGWEIDKLAPVVEQLRPAYAQTRKIIEQWIEQ